MAGELGVHDRIGNLPAERFQVEEYSVDEDYYVESQRRKCGSPACITKSLR
jgi:hypothetical protein